MFIKMQELNQKVPDIKGENSNIYYLSKLYLAKRFLKCYDMKKEYKLQRYEKAKAMSRITGLSLPTDILETEKGFCGYIEPVIPGTFSNDLIDFGDFVNENRYNITLEQISSYIIKCLEIVEQCHDNGIVNPDMSTLGNVKYNKSNGEVYYTDYQDMQVSDIPTSVISSFIALDPIMKTPKYYNNNNGFYTPNIDLYTLAIRFFYYSSKINVPRAINGYNIKQLLEIAGISDTYFGECMRILYDPNKDNLNIKEAIIELCSEYRLTPFKQGEARKFVRK